MAKKVKLELTLAQANALWLAASNSLNDYDDAIAILSHPKTVEAAQRAHYILGDAIVEVS